MAIEKLEIDNVSLELLEKQRILVNSLYDKLNAGQKKRVTANEKDALLGILNMLDSWSDKIYFEKGKNENNYNL